MIAGFRERLTVPSERTLNRLVAWMGILLVVSVAGFGAYYWYDRQPVEGTNPLTVQIGLAEEAIRADPNDLGARLALAGWYFASERYAESSDQYRSALAIDDKNLTAAWGLGRSLYETGNLGEATASFQRIVKAAEGADIASEQVAGAHYFMGKIALDQKDATEAVAQAKAALAIDRSDADAWQLLGAAQVAAGNPDEAIVALAKAVAFVPDFGEAYDALAVAYDQKGMAGEARYARGMKAFSQGRLDAAAKELEAATAASPAFAPAFAGLGLVREKQGKKDAAIAAYETAMNIDATNFNARGGLARLGKLTTDTGGGSGSTGTGAAAPSDANHQPQPAPPADANHKGLAPGDAQKATQP